MIDALRRRDRVSWIMLASRANSMRRRAAALPEQCAYLGVQESPDAASGCCSTSPVRTSHAGSHSRNAAIWRRRAGVTGSGSGPVSMPRAARPIRMPHGVGNGAELRDQLVEQVLQARRLVVPALRRSCGRARRAAPGRTRRRRRCRRSIPPAAPCASARSSPTSSVHGLAVPRRREGLEVLDLPAAVLDPDDELFVAQQAAHRVGREPVGEVREVVEQAGRAQRAADVRAERLQIFLLVAEEHRHRQQQRAAAGFERGLAELDGVPHRRRADADEQRAIRAAGGRPRGG